MTVDELDAAAVLMDTEIRENMHSHYEPGFDNTDEFFAEYCRRHEAKFDETFTY
jgi:hypothetical protein